MVVRPDHMNTQDTHSQRGRNAARNASSLRIFLLALGLTGLASCGERYDDGNTTASGNGSLLGGASNQGSISGTRTPPDSCEIVDMNNWVYQSMNDYYLFYDQVSSNIRTADYATSESLVKDLRVQPQDTFSYMTDETTYNAFFNEGEAFGFGWRLTRAANENIYFSLIDPGSPLDQASVERGDQLLSINSLLIDDFFNLSTQEKTAIVGAGGESKTIELEIRKPAGVTEQISVTSNAYDLQTVLDTQVIEHNGVRVGYLHFYSFISTSSTELDQAFAILAAQNIDELVLDLRFNGGGRISVANELASYILGSGNSDKVFTTFTYNNKYSARNFSFDFLDMNRSLNLYRLFVLQSDRTCSASELVINSLRPFMPVITVGSTSCGKPYGTSPKTACSKVLNALEIELLNANNSGGYFEGISADCPATDDAGKQLGEKTEPLLAAALGYIASGSCNTATARSIANPLPPIPLPRPAWQGGNIF